MVAAALVSFRRRQWQWHAHLRPALHRRFRLGYWAEGEILGEWVLTKTNLQSHMVRLKRTPNDIFTLNLRNGGQGE